MGELCNSFQLAAIVRGRRVFGNFFHSSELALPISRHARLEPHTTVCSIAQLSLSLPYFFCLDTSLSRAVTRDIVSMLCRAAEESSGQLRVANEIRGSVVHIVATSLALSGLWR
jgi:hypothetical protein